ncbi:hypothetical protein GCM10027521_49280 [Amycolatopsis cihanbeyliensis]
MDASRSRTSTGSAATITGRDHSTLPIPRTVPYPARVAVAVASSSATTAGSTFSSPMAWSRRKNSCPVRVTAYSLRPDCTPCAASGCATGATGRAGSLTQNRLVSNGAVGRDSRAGRGAGCSARQSTRAPRTHSRASSSGSRSAGSVISAPSAFSMFSASVPAVPRGTAPSASRCRSSATERATTASRSRRASLPTCRV